MREQCTNTSSQWQQQTDEREQFRDSWPGNWGRFENCETWWWEIVSRSGSLPCVLHAVVAASRLAGSERTPFPRSPSIDPPNVLHSMCEQEALIMPGVRSVGVFPTRK